MLAVFQVVAPVALQRDLDGQRSVQEPSATGWRRSVSPNAAWVGAKLRDYFAVILKV